jgi:hypothetical protein
MSIIEKKSLRKKKAIMMLVESNEYSIPYAMMIAEQLNDEGKLLDNDYEELMEWLEAKLNPPTPEPEEEVVEDDTNID